MTSPTGKICLSITSDEEILAQDLLKRGEIDQTIALYQRLDSNSARVFHIIGALYAENKGDYHSAINYYKQALQIQEKNGDDTSDTLTKLGFTHQNLCEFDSALIYHLRALSLRQLAYNIDQRLVANNLYGIANVYWGQQNLSEALTYAQQALTLNKSIKSGNDTNIAANLAILANIYHHLDDNIRALELGLQALILLERCTSPDSPVLISLLNNIGTIQISAGLYNDAQLTFIRVMHICERTLPKGHPKRMTVERNIQQIAEMQKYNVINTFRRLWNFSTKLFLL